jgi:hypothetical protein
MEAIMADELVADFDFGDPLPVFKTVSYKNKWYILTEPDEAACSAFRTTASQSLQYSGESVVGIKGKIGDLPRILVARCLWHTDVKTREKTKLVTEHELGSWKPEFVAEMFKWCKTVAKLDKKADEKEADDEGKQSPDETGSTSD